MAKRERGIVDRVEVDGVDGFEAYKVETDAWQLRSFVWGGKPGRRFKLTVEVIAVFYTPDGNTKAIARAKAYAGLLNAVLKEAKAEARRGRR